MRITRSYVAEYGAITINKSHHSSIVGDVLADHLHEQLNLPSSSLRFARAGIKYTLTILMRITDHNR